MREGAEQESVERAYGGGRGSGLPAAYGKHGAMRSINPPSSNQPSDDDWESVVVGECEDVMLQVPPNKEPRYWQKSPTKESCEHGWMLLLRNVGCRNKFSPQHEETPRSQHCWQQYTLNPTP